MPNFDQYVMRHGSSWALYIVEQIEQVEGIRHGTPLPLEDRWEFAMRKTANNNDPDGAVSCRM